jgi:hypothetical protein
MSTRFRRLHSAIAPLSVLLLASSPAASPPLHSAPKPPLACNPSVNHCLRDYWYYSDAGMTTVVGHAERDCDGVYTLLSGYATSYSKTYYLFCPY